MGKIKKKLLVIGGTGFIGHHLIKEALKKNWEITSASLSIPTKKNRLNRVKYYKVDIRSILSVNKKLKKSFDYVVNLGGYIDHASFKDKGRKIIQEHFLSVQYLIRTLPRKNLKKFVQIGTSHEYGLAPAPQKENLKETPISAYSFAKAATTNFLQTLHKTENFPFTILRLFLTYGPGQGENRFLPEIINKCLKNKNFPTSHGKQLRDFCYVGDTVRAILLVLESKNTNGEIFNVASGVPLSIASVIKKVSRMIGKGKPIFGKKKMDVSGNMSLYADIKKIKEKLNWKPKISFYKGLKSTIEFYKYYHG